jgi:RNA polymerase sigma-54 factor
VEIYTELEVGQRLQLMLTARMEQRLRLLQAPLTELAGIVLEAMSTNPFLEEDEGPPADPPGEDELGDGLDSGCSGAQALSLVPIVARPDWREQVLAQWRVAGGQENESAIAEYILGSLDDWGYLPEGAAAAAGALGLPVAAVEAVRQRLMRLEPPGLGAVGLRECLTVQLEMQGQGGSLAARIVAVGLDDLARRRYAVLARKLAASPGAVRRAAAAVRRLQPSPRRLIEPDSARPIYPDLRVERTSGGYEVVAEEGLLPRLRFVPPAMRLTRAGGELGRFVRGRTAGARWLLEGLAARRRTLVSVMRLIVEEQREFFDGGIHRLKPLIYRQLSGRLGVHESTIARAVRDKYVQTPRGIFPLRFFFSKGLAGVSGPGGTAASVRARVRELIEGEKSARPLTDEDLTRMLRLEGVRVSRRTVAKYRDQMRIAKASYRRKA